MVNNCVVFGKNVKEMQKYWHILACLELYFYFCLYIQQIAILPLLSRARLFFSRTEGTSRRCLRFSLFCCPWASLTGILADIIH